MIKSGLVSISFRKLSVQEIIALCVQGSLQGIEWGGDVHVPHGELGIAREVRAQTEKAGLAVAAYGSYYRAGETIDNPAFADVLASAVELGAPLIRVWAGKKGSAEATDADRQRVIADLQRIAEMARGKNIQVACEFHAGTLTDTNNSATAMYAAANCDNLRAYWQPPNPLPFPERLAGLKKMLPILCNLHVFHWTINAEGKRERQALEEGSTDWATYLSTVTNSCPGDRWALLEFVKNDDPQQLLADAETLNNWLNNSRN